MNTTIPWQMLLLLALLSQAAADATAGGFFAVCPITRCGEAGPDIRYPFRKVEQNISCGVPGFELTCEDGRTILNLPHEGPFYVQSIDYRYQILQIGDPDGCLVNRTIMPWNLSSSPFHLVDYSDYSLFNCSSIDASTMEDMGYSDQDFIHIDCSTFGSHIYAARSYDALYYEPPSCDRLETTAILDESRYHPNVTTLLSLNWEDRSFKECPITRCGEAGPDIRYPFRKVEQNISCGVPGFELTCEDGRTILNLPHEGPFYVQSIDYRSQILQIGDPDGCLVNRTIMPWNLSSSPLSLLSESNYLLFNCSSIDASTMEDFIHIDCRTFGSHIYAARSDQPLDYELPSCEKLGTTAILDGFGDNGTTLLTLKWDGCKSCDYKGQMCGLNLTTTAPACLNPPPPNHKGGLSNAAIIGIIAAIILSAVLAAAFYYWDHEFGGQWELNQNEVEKFLDSYQSLSPNRYSYSDVKRMTSHFLTKLGEGGFGSVYRGRLPNGLPVAVKTIETSKSNGDEFLNEVATIGRVHHVNVVRLLGFCAERFKQALIYEFMPNGSLEKFIFSSESKPCDLGWDKLQEIAVGIARGIEYLHQGCDQRILHFDIKPHNILLDHKFTPKISDFGLAKFCSKDQSIVSMTAARGTAGYIAPEVVSRNFGNISYKSDVYSFGMLLLEMVGKRKNIDVNVEHTSQVYFPEWIYNRVNLQDELGAGVDGAGEEDEVARKLVIIALWCIQLKPADRPNMKKVVQMLEGASKMLEMPPNPFVSSTT